MTAVLGMVTVTILAAVAATGAETAVAVVIASTGGAAMAGARAELQ